ncbi:MAG: hypothetical protein LBR52_01605 [Prevotellaceae bacterium]|jgi:hypothetical protein|nr:hypothetical protein [Prevotellaceae bacterium]
MKTKIMSFILAVVLAVPVVFAQQKLPDKVYTFTNDFEPENGKNGPFFNASYTLTFRYMYNTGGGMEIYVSDFKRGDITKYRYNGKVYTPADMRLASFSPGPNVDGTAGASVAVVAWLGETRLSEINKFLSKGRVPGGRISAAKIGMEKYEETINTDWSPDPEIIREGVATWNNLHFSVEKPVIGGNFPGIESVIGSYLAKQELKKKQTGSK